MIRVLILENEEALAKRIAASLRELDYEPLIVSDSGGASFQMEETAIQLVIADAGSGGLEFTRELRDTEDITPVIILSGEGSRAEKRRIFRSGADGYMISPIDLEELQMRVRSLLWRCRIVDDAVLRFGGCSLYSQTLTLETPEGEIELRRMEFLLLEKLLSYPGRVFTRAQLMDELWGFDSKSDPRTIDTHIRRLRKKLKEVDDIRLVTVRGLGYRAMLPKRRRKDSEQPLS